MSNTEPVSTVAAPTLAAGEKTTSTDRAMLTVIAVTLAGTCLLISAGPGVEAGHVAWRPHSVLRVLTDWMSLRHQFPTARGVEIKWLVQGLGAAAALLTAVIAWFVSTRCDEEAAGAVPAMTQVGLRGRLNAVSPATGAQIALVLFAGWMLLSAWWAPWPAAALGEGARQLMLVVWAVAVGRTLSQAGARRAAEVLLIVLAVTAAIGIWYYYERNHLQRLKFPIGNPIFLAACLLPGITLGGAMVIGAPSARGGRPGGSRWTVVGAFAALLAVLWAFGLAESRGPGLGLAVGFLFATMLVLSWRKRWLLAGGLAATITVVGILRWWPVSWLLSRPDTVRMRLYAWKYALDLFLGRPDIGRGQGGYLLLAQPMSRADAEADPLAFPGDLLGHAHNEWLQVTADLGAIGIALLATALGITIWAAVVTLRKRPTGTPGAAGPQAWKDRWYLLALLAAVVAIIVEDATDVALRIPGLPVIFYTVIGLLWAISRERFMVGGGPTVAASVPAAGGGAGRAVRVVGLIAGIAGAWGIAAVSARDWAGALAHPAIARLANHYQWDEALHQAAVADSWRLELEARLAAEFQAVQVAHDAAAYRLQQFREMLERTRQARREPGAVLSLAREDVSGFERYFQACLNTGSTLLDRIQMYPFVAGLIADTLLFREEMGALAGQITGLEYPNPEASGLSEARRWLMLEYSRDSSSTASALRLLQLTPRTELMSRRLAILRAPLRSGPMEPALEAAAAALSREPGFDATLNAWLATARSCLTLSNAADWEDPLAPETLRLAALVRKLRGRPAEAVDLAAQAAQLSQAILQRFPTAVSTARREQAYYLLLAYPNQAARAVEAARLAVDSCPPGGNPQRYLELKRNLSLYLLAAGDEAGARRIIEEIVGRQLSPEMLEHNVGYGYAEICQLFIGQRPGDRPATFDRWLARSLELAPQWPTSRLLSARVALERGQDAAAGEHLRALAELLDNPQQMGEIVRALTADFPNRPVLQQLAGQLGVATQPETAPASGPATPAK